MSIFAQDASGMQKLLRQVENFERWSGIKLNPKKTEVMYVGPNQTKQNRAQQLWYNGGALKINSEEEIYRLLGYYATADGDFTETKRRVMERTREEILNIQHHPLETDAAADLFISKAVGYFRFSAAIVTWSQRELEDLHKLWKQGYKAAWHLIAGTADATVAFPKEKGALAMPNPWAVLTQTVIAHINRGLMHDDVVKAELLAELEEAKHDALCSSLQDIQAEMALWTWDQAKNNVWLRMAKGLQLGGDVGKEITVSLPESIESESAGRSTEWANVTRHIRTVAQRLQELDHHYVENEKMPLHIDNTLWSLERADCVKLARGVKAFWRVGRKLWQQDIRSVTQLEQIHCKHIRVPATLTIGQSMANAGTLRSDTPRAQRIRCILPRGIPGITDQAAQQFQGLLDLIDWVGITSVTGSGWQHITDREQKLSNSRGTGVAQCGTCGQQRWAQQQCVCKSSGLQGQSNQEACWLQRLSDKRVQGGAAAWTATQMMETLRDIDADPDRTSRQGRIEDLISAQGMYPDSILEGIRKWLHEEPAQPQNQTHDTISNIWQETYTVLHPNKIREWEQAWTAVRTLLTQHGRVGVRAEQCNREIVHIIDGMNGRCLKCQTRKEAQCHLCDAMTCGPCQQDGERCTACHEVSVEGTKRRQDDRPRKRTQRQKAETGVVNMHNLGRDFIQSVTGARWKGTARGENQGQPVAEAIEFEAVIRQGAQESRCTLIADLLKKNDHDLVRTLTELTPPLILRIPSSLFEDFQPQFEETEWWYRADISTNVWTCPVCEEIKDQDEVAGKRRKVCRSCCQKQGKRTKNTDAPQLRLGVRCRTADPRYIDLNHEKAGGDFTLDVPLLRSILTDMQSLQNETCTRWLTTSQMGFAVTRERNEVDNQRDIAWGRPTARWLAPQATCFIQTLKPDEAQAMSIDLREALSTLALEWGRYDQTECKGTQETNISRRKNTLHWESASTPRAADDPDRVPAMQVPRSINEEWFYNQNVQRQENGKGYVHVQSEAITRTERIGMDTLMHKEGQVINLSLTNGWTISSMQWNHLIHQKQWVDNKQVLVQAVQQEAELQEALEQQDVPFPTWKILRSLQQMCQATRLVGGTLVTAPPFFEHAGRGSMTFWGQQQGAMVILWDTLSATDKQQWMQEMSTSQESWILFRSKTQIKDVTEPTPADTTVATARLPGRCFLTLRPESKSNKDIVKEDIGATRGRAQRQKRWWYKGRVDTCTNTTSMECWTNMDESRIRAVDIEHIKNSWDCAEDKDECTPCFEALEQNYWLGTEAGQMGAYGFHGILAATDGSESNGRMGAGYVLMQDGKLIPSRDELDMRPPQTNMTGSAGTFKVGREHEGVNSLRAELAAIERVLAECDVNADILCLVDCQAGLTKLDRWIGFGRQATLAQDPNADIMRAILERLHERVNGGAATFLTKLKAHSGEPLNEIADNRAKAGRDSGDEAKIWNQSSDRLIFSWHSKTTGIRKGGWSAGVRKGILEAGTWIPVHREIRVGLNKWYHTGFHAPRLNGKEPNKDVVRATKAKLDAGPKEWQSVWQAESNPVDHNTQQQNEDSTKHPRTSTWVADFLIREGESREELGKWLNNTTIPWPRRRHMIQAVAGIFPCNAWLKKIGKHETGECDLCKRHWWKRVPGRDVSDTVPQETLGHIQSAYCLGQQEVVTEAHNKCRDFVLATAAKTSGNVVASGQPEMDMRTLWQNTACLQNLGNWPTVAQAVVQASGHNSSNNEADLEAQITTLSKQRFDGVIINAPNREVIILEVKRTSDRRPDYWIEGRQRAQRQYGDLVQALGAMLCTQGWTLKFVPVVVGTKSINTAEWNKAMKDLRVPEGQRDKARQKCMQILLDAHDLIIRSYWAQKHGEEDGLAAATGQQTRVHHNVTI